MATKCCRNLIIDDLLNIIPLSDRCPPIIQFVADINDAVAGTVAGQLAVERYVEVTGDQHIHLYEWDGAVWVERIDTNARLTDGEFVQLSIAFLDPDWDVSADGGATWVVNDVVFDPPVSSIQVWFRNTVNGCIYTNLPIIPLEAAYCLEYYLVDTTDPLFFFGTINGVDAGDIGLVLASYTDWEGNITTRAFNNLQSDPGIISIFRDSLTPAFSNLGTYVPFGGGAPVIWSPTITNCTRNCYRAVFVSGDLSTEGLTSISAFGGVDLYDLSVIPFDDPTVEAQNLATLISVGFLEPSATLSYSFNGLEVTVTICTSKELYDLGWGTIGVNIGNALFTQL